MYKTAVPVTNWFSNRTLDCEGTLHELERLGAKRVWLCTARGIEAEDVLAEELALLKAHRFFFEGHGLEVGVWMSSLGHGGKLVYDDPRRLERAARYEKLVGLGGASCEDSFCPSGEAFARDLSDWIRRVAETGTRMIMLDDDYRLSLRSCGNGCCCEKHMAEYSRRVGENVRREQLEGLIFRGGANRYRDAWLDMGHDALTNLAKLIRAKVDSVDPSVRVGLCAVMTTWDVDGVNAIALTKALAGGTKPFLRTIGAPYWSAIDAKKKLSYPIELTRLQRHWCAREGIELFGEGDAYPRPRYNTPANYLELFDMALRADGGLDGLLKYVLDYTSSPRYERGYVDRAVRNADAYRWIDAHMAVGDAEGADVLCSYEKLRSAFIPEGMSVGDINSAFFDSAAQRLLADASIPMAYGTQGVHIVCGENGRFVTDEQLADGVVLDVIAAKQLMARGIDIGIADMGPFQAVSGVEYYPEYGEYVAVGEVSRFAALTLKENATPLSQIGGKVSAYRYENAEGARFVVFAFDMWEAGRSQGFLRNYCRQKQLINALEWTGRRKLPATCAGQVDLYIMCKRTAEGLAVGLWNLSADDVIDARVMLDRAYGAAEFFGAHGALTGDCVTLEGEIKPFSFAGIFLRD